MFAAVPSVHVRTAAGVVRIQHGDQLPKDADQEHVERLAARGALSKTKPANPATSTQAEG